MRKASQVHVGSDWPWHISKCDGRPLKDCQQEFELEGVFARMVHSFCGEGSELCSGLVV